MLVRCTGDECVVPSLFARTCCTDIFFLYQAPGWFQTEEKRYNKPQLPITKEMMLEQKRLVQIYPDLRALRW